MRIGLLVRSPRGVLDAEPVRAGDVAEILDRAAGDEVVRALAGAEGLGELHLIVRVREGAGARVLRLDLPVDHVVGDLRFLAVGSESAPVEVQVEAIGGTSPEPR